MNSIQFDGNRFVRKEVDVDGPGSKPILHEHLSVDPVHIPVAYCSPAVTMTIGTVLFTYDHCSQWWAAYSFFRNACLCCKPHFSARTITAIYQGFRVRPHYHLERTKTRISVSFNASCTSAQNTGQETQCRDENDRTNNIDLETNEEKAIVRQNCKNGIVRLVVTRFYGGKAYRSCEVLWALSRTVDAGVEMTEPRCGKTVGMIIGPLSGKKTRGWMHEEYSIISFRPFFMRFPSKSYRTNSGGFLGSRSSTTRPWQTSRRHHRRHRLTDERQSIRRTLEISLCYRVLFIQDVWKRLEIKEKKFF